MAAISLEPIIEIFVDETFGLLDELTEIRNRAIESNKYEKSDIEEIFRIIHTIKADSTMVLFEDLAELGRTFEKLLYFYRDEQPDAVKPVEFTAFINETMEFVREETEKVAFGREPDKSSADLCERLRNYLAKEKNDVSITVLSSDKEQQIYYIPSKVTSEDEAADETEKEVIKKVRADQEEHKKELSNQKEQESLYKMQMGNPMYPIKEESLSILHDISEELAAYINEFEIAAQSRLGKIAKELTGWIRNEYLSDFNGVTIKIRKTVEEMEQRTGKQINLDITGDYVTIEKNKIDRISGALIHVIRNSIDHGIESVDERKANGKSAEGNISIEIKKDVNTRRVVITVEDDGKGADRKAILRKARLRQLTDRPDEDYTDDEVLEFLFAPGFSTREGEGEYSGRGVGMDVVRTNIKEIKGNVYLINQAGKGFKVRIAVPTNVI